MVILPVITRGEGSSCLHAIARTGILRAFHAPVPGHLVARFVCHFSPTFDWDSARARVPGLCPADVAQTLGQLILEDGGQDQDDDAADNMFKLDLHVERSSIR